MSQLVKYSDQFCSWNLRIRKYCFTFAILNKLIFEISDAGLIKQGLYESPYITMTLLFFPFPFLMAPYVIWRYEKLDGAGKRYVHRYTSESKTSISTSIVVTFIIFTKIFIVSFQYSDLIILISSTSRITMIEQRFPSPSEVPRLALLQM